MIDHIGEWHVMEVDIFEGDLDYDVIHLESCRTEAYSEDEPFPGIEYLCDLGVEISNAGFEKFEIIKPGIYRARYISIKYGSSLWHGEEWDGDVEVEEIQQ